MGSFLTNFLLYNIEKLFSHKDMFFNAYNKKKNINCPSSFRDMLANAKMALKMLSPRIITTSYQKCVNVTDCLRK